MTSLRHALLVTLALALLAASCRSRDGGASPGDGDVHTSAAAFFAGQPTYFQPLADTDPPEGLTSMDSATCGGCHIDQLAEWRDSIHARAWDDDQYQAELAKDPGVSWICINCHLPLFDQQARLPVALTDGDLRQPVLADNPTYDETLRDDAIGCAACHVREGWVEGPTGSAPGAPHRARKSPNLTDPSFCTRCHGVEVYVEELELICAFATGREWEAWRAAGDGDAATRCQDCHMPTVQHRRWSGAAPAAGPHHAFPGSLIPKRPADTAAFEALQAIFPEGVEVAISVLPAPLAGGATATARVVLHNARAGHSVPTGDPERYLEVRTMVVDADGALLAEQVEVIRSRYEWHPRPKLLSDNRLAAGEERVLEIPFVAPGDGDVRVTVQVDKYRIDQHALEYHHLGDKVVAGRLSSRTVWPSATGP
jgi:hypothetical protein